MLARPYQITKQSARATSVYRAIGAIGVQALTSEVSGGVRFSVGGFGMVD